jgi:hypothetical protein
VEHDAEFLPFELLQVDARDADARDAATETVILLEGELDIRSTDWFGAYVGTVLEKHPASIVIDSGGLTFMDSSGAEVVAAGPCSGPRGRSGPSHRATRRCDPGTGKHDQAGQFATARAPRIGAYWRPRNADRQPPMRPTKLAGGGTRTHGGSMIAKRTG